ncbi:MAG: methylenetetrahydrofolate--tRNA-(uracil(54)-C(5))-methyltransferase (FADH(2)-oxidizing) TrmFO [Candidatus Riflebacteria bacterium]|nr:methylenetetrahydrofolate--tRNA-(uracil(54)-C(5))-methyltransferase (FADH(2)-oxidizing) TrmFO [Candidatus Riflebacteria bacterium]
MAKKTVSHIVNVIGGGLAGSEAAYQLIRRGIRVKLYEMRPLVETGAHRTQLLSELVCSNSMGSNLPDRASGLLKEELRAMNSYILDSAYKYRVPAGQALAVDRDAFSREITRFIKTHTMVEYINEEVTKIPEDEISVIATGPLTSPTFVKTLISTFGAETLSFFDAIAPLLKADSVDMTKAFKANRYDDENGGGDYINCPLSKVEYQNFVQELLKAEKIPLPAFEKDAKKMFFSACQPVEEIAASGLDSLRFGPMKPTGLTDPVEQRRPYAIVQLRQDNLLGSLFNMVGFQTNLKFSEQKRVFSMIPALANAEFIRYGQMHRNIFLQSPLILNEFMQVKKHPNIFIGGQITGVEGYCESTGTGLLAGLNVSRLLLDKPMISPPPESILGALIKYITFPGHKHFTPMNANFGLFDTSAESGKLMRSVTAVEDEKGEKSNVVKNSKADRKAIIVAIARKAFREFMSKI